MERHALMCEDCSLGRSQSVASLVVDFIKNLGSQGPSIQLPSAAIFALCETECLCVGHISQPAWSAAICGPIVYT
ncbi:hypothetical protein CEXT_254641 [Caerostris extrusa]|uniref:Uncharacterized protein n=1 Tax=Caerostris extrusa TaxID=172846 RepID=A0AAV4NV32_CAEEX|nr:hypothetical protein CEXT_254641 [Caerostris extrusa]